MTKKRNEKVEEPLSASAVPRGVSGKHSAPFGNTNYVIVEEEVKVERIEEAKGVEELQKQLERLKTIKKKISKVQKSEQPDL